MLPEEKIAARLRLWADGEPVAVEDIRNAAYKLELAARDAARYRWLRSNANEPALYEHCGYEGSDAESMICGERLDEAIDAAMPNAKLTLTCRAFCGRSGDQREQRLNAGLGGWPSANSPINYRKRYEI